MHAQILLKVDQGEYGPRWKTEQIEEALDVGETVIRTTKKRFVENGLEDAINRRPQPERPEKRKIDGEKEAQIVVLMCTEQPEGQERWTLRALNQRVVELEIVENVSRETIRTVLHKNELKPWQKKQWCVGPTGNGSFVAHMEDVLDVYKKPYDPKRPRICMDEGSVQLVSEKMEALPMEPGKVKREDYEYKREGFSSVFLACEPLTGKFVVEAKERRTKQDFAHFLRDLLDIHYPEVEQVELVMENLNTHVLASFYHTFPPEEARRICKKLDIHYTPLHGSWLNMAEIGLSVLGRQCLSGRIASVEDLQTRIGAWLAKIEQHPLKINWQFTADDARIKLKRLYPSIEGGEVFSPLVVSAP